VCTLIAAAHLFPDWPLVVAANRDEHLDRPSTPPRLWTNGHAFIAPRDEVAGGTWLGLNQAGVFVGVTNRFGVPKDNRRRSRGTLVVNALRNPSARAVHEQLASTPASIFNAFHLLYADRQEAFVSWSDGKRVTQQALTPGLHVVTERSLGGDDHGRTELIRARWGSGPREPLEESLQELLRQHATDPIGAVCVHAPALNYGTRSSTILLLSSKPGATRIFWAEGNPCTADYVELGTLVRSLGV
jgi:uncharacterized protein with NRDE domain